MSDQPGDVPQGGQPSQPPYGQPGYGQPPYGYPAPGPYHPPKQTEGYAIAVFVTAVCSFFVCPLVPAIVALALAPTARRNIAASGGQKDGEGFVTAGVIVAWCNIGLTVLGVIGFLVLLSAVDDNTAAGLSALLA